MAGMLLEINTDALNRARARRGLLLREVATTAGIGLSTTYQAFATGRCGLKVARSIAVALNLSLPDIIVEPEACTTDGKN